MTTMDKDHPDYLELHRRCREAEAEIEALKRTSAARPGSTSAEGSFQTHLDIGDRKQAEEQLRFHSTVLDQIGDLVTVTDLKGVITYMNAAARRSLGYENKELIGAKIEKLSDDPQRGATQREILQQTLRMGQWRGEVVNRTADGEEIILDCRTHIVRDETGSPIALCGISTDITERKKMELSLKESRELLASTERLVMVGGWEWDVLAQRMKWTDETYRIHDLEPGELEPGSPEHIAFSLSCYVEEDRDRIERAFLRCVETGEPYELEVRLVTNKGRRKWVQTQAKPLFADGRVVKVQGHIADITARKQAEDNQRVLRQQLEHSQKMESIGRLAGGVAHDFNNMLAVILGNLELLQDNIAHWDQETQSRLSVIKTAAERSASLTRQLLGFARKQAISPRVLDLNAAVATTLEMVGRLIGEHIVLVWKPKMGIGKVNIDPSQLDQILANLAVNARDAIGDSSGRLEIETDTAVVQKGDTHHMAGVAPGSYVTLVMRDNGRGMSESTKARIFEPFFTTKGVGEGTGLGLATVYGIVSQNHGFIHVISEPGEGAAFVLYFPTHTAPPTKDIGDEPGQRLGSKPGETLLLVEDEPAVLELIDSMLRKLGYAVLSASNPREALRLAREHEGAIDLVVTDVVMPEMNGRDMAEALLRIYPAMKRIFISGYDTDVIARRAASEEGIKFVNKPFTMEALSRAVRETLDK